MPIQYTVQPGDTLSGIAKKHGLASWRDIYDLSENTGFRRKRPNPDRIFPGDIVTIPVAGPPNADGRIRLCGRKEVKSVNPFGLPGLPYVE